MKKSRLLGAVCASITLFSTSAIAAPVTLDFSGVIAQNSDFTSSVTYGVGTTFSGYVTYDVANAENINFQTSNPGNTSGFAYSQSGCTRYDNGVCTNDRGTGTPVVTDYQFNWIGGTVNPWGYSLDFQDSSRRANLFDIPPAPITGEGWDVVRNQFRVDFAGDINNSNYTRTVTQTQFNLQAYSNNNALLSGPIDDFMQGFNENIFSSDGTGYVYMYDFSYVETCTSGNNCTTAYNSGSYQLVGNLTSVSFRSSVIPIPPAIWLFGSGLVGLLGVARRRVS